MHRDEFIAIAVGLLSSLYNAAFRLTRDEDEAEDLVQDTYSYAFAHADELRSIAAAKPWLMRILYHRFYFPASARWPRAQGSRGWP
jgi:RNA polymerase sigma-70 factor (ECF subfamily)